MWHEGFCASRQLNLKLITVEKLWLEKHITIAFQTLPGISQTLIKVSVLHFELHYLQAEVITFCHFLYFTFNNFASNAANCRMEIERLAYFSLSSHFILAVI